MKFMVTFVFIIFSFVVSSEQPCYAVGTYCMTCDGLVYLAQWDMLMCTFVF